MELLVKELFHGGFGTLTVGETTEGKDISEEMKLQLLTDHPEWFEVIGEVSAEEKEELPIQTPEDSLGIETPEAKLTKTIRKK